MARRRRVTTDVTTKPVRKKRTTRWNRLPAKTVFAACEGLVTGMKIEDIAKKISEQSGETIWRTQIHKVIAEGMARGYLRLSAPLEQSLADDLRARFANASHDKSIEVVVQSYDVSLVPVAAAGAKTALRVIHECWKRKKDEYARGKSRALEPVRAGFGTGMTMTMVARNLAELMRGEADRPRLNIHSLTAGFRNDEPHNAANSFCIFFHDMPEVRHTALYSMPYVFKQDWENICKTMPGVSDSMRESEKIDVIITALASEEDEHGELNRLFSTYKEKARVTESALKRQGRVGDVMHRPYSKTGAIEVDDELRAATLFEIDRLVKFARRPNKAVILVAGPCGGCRKPRHRALRPLLTAPALNLWTHLVTDDVTVRRCIESD